MKYSEMNYNFLELGIFRSKRLVSGQQGGFPKNSRVKQDTICLEEIKPEDMRLELPSTANT